MTAQQKQEAMRVMEDRWRHGPTGIMVVHPDGAEVMTPRQLATQLGADVLAMLVAAILLAQLPSIGFGRKVLFVMLMALFPTLQSELPIWNWYGFPAVWTASSFTIHLVGFALGGLILAKLISSGAGKTAAAAA
jgi:hypothetical protein